MKRVSRFLPLLVLIVATVVVTGCAKQTQAPPTPPPAPPRETPPPEPTPEPEPTPPPAPREIGSSDFQPVFYDYDSYSLRADGRSALDSNARVLRENPNVRITIEGHCDERGTIEYNLALGERRAMAAKEYLVAAGIAASRITTISYGEERPFDPGQNESAWAKNRRAHFVVQ